jgi:hypothetical protein
MRALLSAQWFTAGRERMRGDCFVRLWLPHNDNETASPPSSVGSKAPIQSPILGPERSEGPVRRKAPPGLPS